ncbi:MAG: SAM-dependent methyltransferase [Thalassobius sp.]|nr:SAM-dependent methyltransferase [Thalassovita sp.]
MEKTWKQHYNQFNSKNIPPAATLVKALTLFSNEKFVENNKQAIDLGCGNGVDSLEILKQGWDILVIDQEKDAIEQLENRISPDLITSFKKLCCTFEELNVLPKAFLVNASFSLPFCKPESFENFWNLILNSLLPSGVFAGHFFGIEDSWNNNPNMTFHSKNDIEFLFSDFKVEAFKEVNKVGKTISGKEKHWHVFHVVARKKTT